jgi:gliding motility-associated-like protein
MLVPFAALATHQKACEITYECLGGYTYRMTLVSYTFTGTATDRPYLEINWGDGTVDTVRRRIQTVLPDAAQTYYNEYIAEHTYSGPGGYYISMTDPTRNGGVINVPGSVDISMYVQTYLVVDPFLGCNNSPVLTNRPIDRACVGQPFVHNPGAYDPDGDSLSYKLISCKMDEGMDIPGYSFPAASKSFSIDERTGDVVWDAPIYQGEYNIAILIEEWRYGVRIGYITRDMQITVQQCNNRPPVLHVQNHCAIAGDSLAIPIVASDPDGDRISITVSGELEGPVLLSVADTLSVLSWRVPFSAARANPYIVYCKATDFGSPCLSDLKNFSINIVAPAVELYGVLNFSRSPVPHATGYKIYRRQGSSEPQQDSCKGGLSDPSFTLVATTLDTFYTDTSRLQNGMTYCYRVTTVLRDGSESLFSNEQCFLNHNDGVPVITHASVEKTHQTQGVVKVRWQMLHSDTNGDYSQKQYTLFRIKNDTAISLRTFAFDTAVTFYDSSCNTRDGRQEYAVTLDTMRSDIAPTLWIYAFTSSRKVVIRWQDDQIWNNRYYRIYRKLASENNYIQIARTSSFPFTDTLVQNDEEYHYYIEGEGTYFSGELPSPLLNKSNEISAIPHVLPPCVPQVTSVDGSCDPFANTIKWTCDGEDIKEYEIYSARVGDTNYKWIITVPAGAEMQATDENPMSYNICYVVKAVNTKGEESPYSNAVCIDNRYCFRLKLPNIFTPNGDGVNDVFRPLEGQTAEDFEIQIFDRWGKLVYKAKEFPFSWNGCYMGGNQACPDGAYFYVAEFSAPAEGLSLKQMQNGSVVILR